MYEFQNNDNIEEQKLIGVLSTLININHIENSVEAINERIDEWGRSLIITEKEENMPYSSAEIRNAAIFLLLCIVVIKISVKV